MQAFHQVIYSRKLLALVLVYACQTLCVPPLSKSSYTCQKYNGNKNWCQKSEGKGYNGYIIIFLEKINSKHNRTPLTTTTKIVVFKQHIMRTYPPWWCLTTAHPNMMHTQGIILFGKKSSSCPKMLGKQKCGHQAKEKRHRWQSWEFTVKAPMFPNFDLRGRGLFWWPLWHLSSSIDINSIAANLIPGNQIWKTADRARQIQFCFQPS